MASIRAKLTKRLVDSLRPLPDEDLFAQDTDLHGYGIRMKPSGAASYYVHYRTPQGRRPRHTFAKVGTVTPEEARTKARRLLAGAQDGKDPSAERHEAREALTTTQLCDVYMTAAREGLVATRFKRPKKASTIAIDEGRIARHIVPLLGHRVANSLRRPDVQRTADAIAAGKTAGIFKAKARGKAVVTGGAGTAARVVELLGGIWSWAERRGLVSGVNPAHGIETQRGLVKDRVLSHAEIAALGKALDVHGERSPLACGALRLIALAGPRREEACGLRWREIDWDGQCLRLRETKAGRSIRPIGKEVLDVLRSFPRMHDEFVFPNRSGTGNADLKKQIASIFDAAGLKDARSHDLRRTFASIAAELGYGDAAIGELLGHAKRGVTERHYVRRPDAVLISAADRVAHVIARALRGLSEVSRAPRSSPSGKQRRRMRVKARGVSGAGSAAMPG